MNMTAILESAARTARELVQQLQMLGSDALTGLSGEAGKLMASLDARAGGLESQLEALPIYATMALAFVVLVLARRLYRTRAALRGLASEMEGARAELVEARKVWSNTEVRVNRLLADVANVHSRQRSFESRLGKPDPKVAAAMSRAGTRPQQMVDCGLSHSEVHLLNALASAKAGNTEVVSAVQ